MLAFGPMGRKSLPYVQAMLENSIHRVEITRNDWAMDSKCIKDALLETSSVKRLQINFVEEKDIVDILDTVASQKSKSITELIIFGSNPKKSFWNDERKRFPKDALDRLVQMPHLTSIEFEYFRFGSNNPLFSALAANKKYKSLTTLGLYDCVSKSMIHDPYNESLTDIIQNNTTLKKLSITKMERYTNMLDCITGALQHNTTLETFDLENSKIGICHRDGAGIHRLVQNTHIKHLNLSRNELSTAGILACLAGAFQNPNIQSLNFYMNPYYFDPKDEKDVMIAIKKFHEERGDKNSQGESRNKVEIKI